MATYSLDWDIFKQQFNLADLDEKLAKAGLDRDGLQAIYADHCQRGPDLEPVGAYVADRLRKREQVHSIRSRVKSPDHLVEKIIRKKCERPEPAIAVDNYRSEITDLIGVRALHLLKSEWTDIHEFISGTWQLAETPIAYYREGDPQQVVDQFAAAGCETERHGKGYRSVHYLVKTDEVVEVQVRTIFEEGWSEIDHRVRYPYGAPAALTDLLDLFNRLAGSADEMGTCVAILRGELEAREEEIGQARRQLDHLIRKLSVSEQEKSDLRREIERLSQASPAAGSTVPLTARMEGVLSGLTTALGPTAVSKAALELFANSGRGSVLPGFIAGASPAVTLGMGWASPPADAGLEPSVGAGGCQNFAATDGTTPPRGVPGSRSASNNTSIETPPA